MYPCFDVAFDRVHLRRGLPTKGWSAIGARQACLREQAQKFTSGFDAQRCRRTARVLDRCVLGTSATGARISSQ